VLIKRRAQRLDLTTAGLGAPLQLLEMVTASADEHLTDGRDGMAGLVANGAVEVVWLTLATAALRHACGALLPSPAT
jgi:hypothetical protein